MKVLVFAASLRKASLNRKFAALAAGLLERDPSLQIDHADYRDFEMPPYDGDLEEASGLPSGSREFINRIQQAGAIVISTPEYNGSIPGTLKNAIDWASRAKPNPLDKKPVLLLGASPGALGAVRGLWHTRVPLEALGAFVYPQMHGLSKAHEAFDDAGQLRDSKAAEQLMTLLQTFVQFANATNSTGK